MAARYTPWYGFVRGFVRVFYFQASGGFSIYGLENVPLEGPLIVAPNHSSNLDPPATACSINRQITFMAKSELFKVPILGALIRSLGSFPVHRGETDTEAIRLTLRLLSEGKAVLVFPEGTRGDGKNLGSVNRGIAMLAKRSGAPVLPVGIVGTHRKLPRGRAFSGFGRTTVRYGKPLCYGDFAEGRRDSEARDLFTQAWEKAVVALCGQSGLDLARAEATRERAPSP